MWYESIWFNFSSWIVFAIIFLTLFQDINEISWSTAGFISIFFIFIFTQFILTGLKFKNQCAPSERGIFIGEHRFKFDENSIHSEGIGYNATHDWSIVKRLEKTSEYIYLFLDNAHTFIFPLCQIEESAKFYDFISSKINIKNSPK